MTTVVSSLTESWNKLSKVFLVPSWQQGH
jgi:hypothetical protein